MPNTVNIAGLVSSATAAKGKLESIKNNLDASKIAEMAIEKGKQMTSGPVQQVLNDIDAAKKKYDDLKSNTFGKFNDLDKRIVNKSITREEADRIKGIVQGNFEEEEKDLKEFIDKKTEEYTKLIENTKEAINSKLKMADEKVKNFLKKSHKRAKRKNGRILKDLLKGAIKAAKKNPVPVLKSVCPPLIFPPPLKVIPPPVIVVPAISPVCAWFCGLKFDTFPNPIVLAVLFEFNVFAAFKAVPPTWTVPLKVPLAPVISPLNDAAPVDDILNSFAEIHPAPIVISPAADVNVSSAPNVPLCIAVDVIVQPPTLPAVFAELFCWAVAPLAAPVWTVVAATPLIKADAPIFTAPAIFTSVPSK